MNQKVPDVHSYCFNPSCQSRLNPYGNKFCKSCGSSLILAERYGAIRLLGQGISERTFLCLNIATTPSSVCVVKQSWGELYFYLPPQLQALFAPKFQHQELGEYAQIPKCLDQFELKGVFYRVEEYIPGENLATVLARKVTFNAHEVWQILASLLPVIHHIHSCGVIHGDIKPENIICRASLKPSQNWEALTNLVLVDIGAVTIPSVMTAIQTITVQGGPYAAPEQLRGQLLFANDLYSLGVTCIHLLTGIHPFHLLDFGDRNSIWENYWLPDAANAQEQLQNQQLAKFLNRLIAPNLNQRFSSALEAITEIEQLRQQKTINPVLLQIDEPEPPHQKWRCEATLTGHHSLFANVNAVAIAPNGNILASASDDKTVRIWDLQTQKECMVLRDHSQFVKSVAFHPHAENTLASGSRDRQINIWDIQTGKVIQTLNIHEQTVNVVEFSPNGEILASGSTDKTIALWDFESGKQITSLKGHILAVNALAFSSYSSGRENIPLLASASSDSTIRLWNLKTLESVDSLTGHIGAVRAIAFSPNGKWLATGGEDRTIRLWDIESRQCIRIISAHPWLVSAVKFSADGETLISGSWDKTVKLWEVSTGNEIGILTGHKDSVNSVDIGRDGSMIVSGSNDQTIKIWKL